MSCALRFLAFVLALGVALVLALLYLLPHSWWWLLILAG